MEKEVLNKTDVKIVLFCATEKGFSCLKKLIASNCNISLVVTFKEVDVQKGYDKDIMELACNNNIAAKYWKDVKADIVQTVLNSGANVAFTIGWKYLLPIELNEILKYKLIVFHDSLLPKYRGFAPTPTAIMCGETELGVTAIVASENVDEGDIVLQKKIKIEDSEPVADIIKKESNFIGEMIIEIINLIRENKIKYLKQDSNKATYSIWRGAEDYRIDWNKSAKEICNQVRALGYPYKGAYTYYKNEKIIITKAEVCDDLAFAIRDVGKIWSISDNRPVVICSDGMIKITEAAFENGQPVVFDKLRERLGVCMSMVRGGGTTI